MQHQITKKTDLLTPSGTLSAKGYAVRMHLRYNREQVKTFPLKLKEWNFYQIRKGSYVLQMTLGHVSYMCSVAATLMDITTGQKWEFGTMKPLYVPKLDRDPEGESLNVFEGKDFFLSFQVTGDQRILEIRGKNKIYDPVDIRIVLENHVENEKMVIATPFEKSRQFYLNYKENYYRGAGYVRFGDKIVDFSGCTGLLDWGRGVWPYRHEWYWGSLTASLEGVPFGFNIGWGFGDLRQATENMIFYNKKAYKLGVLQVVKDDTDFMKPWQLKDPERDFSMTFTPKWNNETMNRFWVVDTHCDQVFGTFSGSFRIDGEEKRFENLPGFLEHAVNRW